MLPYRRPYKVLRLSTSLHRLVLAQFPRFLLIFLSRFPYAVWCYTMLPYNCRSRSSLLAAFSRTILWTAKTLFVSSRHQYKVHVPCCSHRQDSNSSPCLSVCLSVSALREWRRGEGRRGEAWRGEGRGGEERGGGGEGRGGEGREGRVGELLGVLGSSSPFPARTITKLLF